MSKATFKNQQYVLLIKAVVTLAVGLLTKGPIAMSVAPNQIHNK
jgi:hypothetical protein